MTSEDLEYKSKATFMIMLWCFCVILEAWKLHCIYLYLISVLWQLIEIHKIFLSRNAWASQSPLYESYPTHSPSHSQAITSAVNRSIWLISGQPNICIHHNTSANCYPWVSLCLITKLTGNLPNTILDKVFITHEIKFRFPKNWDMVSMFSGLFF